MAIYQVQHICHHTSGLPKDDVVTTAHFLSGEGVATSFVASALAGFVAAKHYDASVGGLGTVFLEQYYSQAISRVVLPTIKVYDAVNPGSALATATQLAMRAAAAATYLPEEVALCGSYRANVDTLLEEAPDDADLDSAPERPRSRARGRMYFGPFNQTAVGTAGRPHDNLRDSILDYLRLLATSDTTTGALQDNSVQFVVFSREDGQTRLAVHAHVDNAWDTQRRRGQAASGRVTMTLV